jgi:hypothetical protein
MIFAEGFEISDETDVANLVNSADSFGRFIDELRETLQRHAKEIARGYAT